MMSYNPFSLEGRNILITGASSGIGRSCSVECAKSGANLLLLGRDLTKLNDVLSVIQNDNLNYNGTASVYSIDLTTGIEDLIPVVDEFVFRHGKFDGLIHSAGIEKTMPLAGMKDSDYSSIFNINVIAGFQVAKLISKRKNSNDSSSFVFISSITALVGRRGIIGYSASKGALNSGIKSMALELADRGIRANCISPGTILTPLLVNYLETLTPEERAKRLDGYPLGIGKPEDIAYAAIYLLSGASRWITGQSLIIDGGYTSR
ncbi:MAG TPA: SDR family oxidoreductase [Bacteroidales bacterium]|nr:SDR family oxidoreductase [Bacteroidales bacterium]